AKGEVQKCETILLGEHNISNILIASRVAFEMGVSLKEISAGIKKLHTIQHRLEIVKSSSTYTIIDDAYNSSVEGSKASLNVLSKFAGSKFVITPGLVELGDEQYNSNFEFGKNMAEVCDYVIVDYASNFKAISEGLKSANFDENKIIQVANLTQAVELLNKLAKKDDVVLFENDLPDNYS
ncbi:MAG: UDP-N-acetylmuramoyl-tripeptide--D-alanyl-D-alanine ligase, partial [Clostridia bacterium]|nr:UDP-N-acetylmuramoyl-tripeptide--D-alanyl-D-alanine ligase [Clostridia bacterium]